MDYSRGLRADAGRMRHHRFRHGFLRFLHLRWHDLAEQWLWHFGYVWLR